MRFFNTAGPIIPEDHYNLPPLDRLDLPDVLSLIEQKKYFVLHAPRQTGKTSCLLSLMERLNREGKYAALYCNVEAAQAARENVPAGMEAILSAITERSLLYLKDDYPKKHRDEALQEGAFTALNKILSGWAEKSSKPLVLFIDEIDALVGDTLISVLRQLRSGYDKRPLNFPQSIILCGVRDVRDYRIHSSTDKAIVTGGSAFNIKAESLRLGNFIEAEVRALLEQHTTETGQRFTDEALRAVWELTRGQPWLVNALAYEACFKMKSGRDRNVVITQEMILEAKENLILRRDTHLDQLSDKLKEERVRRVLEPLLAGADHDSFPQDDVSYLVDLGLIEVKGQMRISNPIYAEIIPRELTYATQVTMAQQTAWFVGDDGRLDMQKLIAAFQEFFREHSEHWLGRFDYREAGPQLLLQAFLQRIINSGGRIEREYGLGLRRTDLFVIWPLTRGEGDKPIFTGPVQKFVIELKILYNSLERTLSDGLQQTAEYMDRSGASDGHLLIFDRRPGRAWEEKVFCREEEFEGRRITVWGM